MKLSKDTTIDSVAQKVLTLLIFSIEDYVKLEDGLTIMDTLYRANNGDVQQLAMSMSEVMMNVQDTINEDERLINSLSIELEATGTHVKATIQIEKANGEHVSTVVY
jgi:hypothetical protein